MSRARSDYTALAHRAQYSGDSGATWASQVAPDLPSYFYSLTSVVVLRGTLAFAAGGNPFGTTGTTATGGVAQNGVIIATFNGGFTWTAQARMASAFLDVLRSSARGTGHSLGSQGTRARLCGALGSWNLAGLASVECSLRVRLPPARRTCRRTATSARARTRPGRTGGATTPAGRRPSAR